MLCANPLQRPPLCEGAGWSLVLCKESAYLVPVPSVVAVNRNQCTPRMAVLPVRTCHIYSNIDGGASVRVATINLVKLNASTSVI